MVGASSEDIRLCDTQRIVGEKIPPRDLGLTTKAINYDDKSGTKMMFAKNINRHYMSGGELLFSGVRFNGEKSVQLHYATSGRGGRLKILCGEELICEQIIPGTPCATDFTYVTVPIKPKRGIHDLRIRIDGISLLEFKLA